MTTAPQGQFITNAPSGANPYASASLYVGDLLPDVTEATLFELFNAVGPVASIRVCRDSQTRRSLGYAYVNFHSVQDAERALDTMNFTAIRGNPCRIMWSQRDPTLRQSGKGNIFVKNLHDSIDNHTLYDTFSVFGNILSCKVMRDEKSGRSLEYGYVHYADEDSARNAIEGVDGMMISQKKVVAQMFKPRTEREAGRRFTNVYVKHIPTDWDQERLKALFEEQTGGTIDSVYWKQNDYGTFACVNFSDHEHAANAVTNLHEFQTGDEERPALYVARAQNRALRQKYLQNRSGGRRSYNRRNFTGVNLYVKNLSPDTTDEKLTDLFKEFGTITSCRVMLDKVTHKSRGFGFVCFDKKEEAVRAITEMNSRVVDGKPLYVSRAQRKAARQAWLARQRSRMQMGGGVPQGGYPQYPAYNQMSQPRMPMQMGQFPRQQFGPRPTPGGYPPQQQMYPHQQQMMPPPQMHGQGSYGMPQQMYGQQPQMNRPVQMPYPGGRPMQTPQSYGNQPNVAPVPSGPTTSVPQPASTTMSSAPQVLTSEQPLTAQLLASVKTQEQKRLIGERLFPRIQQVEPRLAGKITGMLLEMDNTELLMLIDSRDALMRKINEALQVLREHQQAQSSSNQNPNE